MTASFHREAQELARKAIAWRAEADFLRRQGEERAVELQRTTWRALERFSPASGSEIDQALGRTYAWLHERVKGLDRLDDQIAQQILARWCEMLGEIFADRPEIAHQVRSQMTRWDGVLAGLDAGGFDDYLTWADLLRVLRPPPITRALLELIYDLAPQPDGSDSILAR
jgi:hypothetical protein